MDPQAQIKPLISVKRVRRDRRMIYSGAVTAATKLKEFIELATSSCDENGCLLPPITPEVMNAYQKAAGLALLIGPLPGEAKYIAPAPRTIEPQTEPQSIDDLKPEEIAVIRLHDASGEHSKKKRKAKAG